MLMLYAACSQRLSSSLMATKPQRLHQIASGASILGSGKKPRAMTTSTATADSPMREEFAKYTDYLNQLNDKRERVVKASRDVTMNSKKVIFQVQEYVEAATLCRFCKAGTLLNLAEINASLLSLSDESLEPLQINVLDYLLGI
ncbi:Translin family [Musa troglodytarum]|uniref:Translin family n=1 Tax=Musa troglodytarum TaxID=320322 RepID=A0A9E7FFB9_9LILI|nr:Translin family [Musa troglodytarum]